jgi:RES domain
MRHVRRGGRYLRVADQGWSDPLSGAYSRAAGGRWNPPGAFDVVYLNANIAVARAQVRRKLAPLGIGPEDLDPITGPVLVATEVPTEAYVDAVSDPGLRSLGLSGAYPLDAAGAEVGHEICRPLGLKAHEAGEVGVAARSAAAWPGEELAYFGGSRLRVKERTSFADWFWPAG